MEQRNFNIDWNREAVVVAVDLSAGRVAGIVEVEAAVVLLGTRAEAADVSKLEGGAVAAVEIAQIEVVLPWTKVEAAVGIGLASVR